jgi:hypothetical protein
MDDKTSWTPGPEDNKLGFSDKNLINELEAKELRLLNFLFLDLTVIYRFQPKSS